MLFEDDFQKYLPSLIDVLQTEQKEWTVKGFVDTHRNIYGVSVDTKVVSKIIELMIFPKIKTFANDNNYEVVLAPYQNYYPDISFVHRISNEKFALDIKTSYRKNLNSINGMTLGAFTGYFRDRSSTKNTCFPYNEYSKHYVLGIIYSRTEEITDETVIHHIDNIEEIESIAHNFEMFFCEKWRIAVDRPGSGNTKNIGGITDINDLLNARGPFTEYENGKDLFDDYWMNYETKGMANENNRDQPFFQNLESYFVWRRNNSKTT